MFIFRPVVLLLLLLSGCTAPQGGSSLNWMWPWQGEHPSGLGHFGPGTGKEAAYGRFSFDWHLSGDPEIMPVQVFDDGERMWLQFQPDGAWPAVFDAGEAGWRPLPFRRDGHYMIIDGVYAHLALRGGHLQGNVRANVDSAAGNSLRVEAHTLPDTAQSGDQLSPEVPTVVPGTAVMPGGAEADESNWSTRYALPSTVQDVAGRPLNQYAVSPADVTMRQALQRWATLAGWTFSVEHWAVDVDIPLVGDASFQTDFKSAVRELLSATEMGDRPLQPCFYSNRVVRVVAYAEPCDRRKGMGAMS